MNTKMSGFIIRAGILYSFFLLTNAVWAGKDKGKDTIAILAPKIPKKKKSFDDSLKAFKRYEGLFKFYQDTTNGSILMVIKKEQVNKEFIYFNYSENGPVQSGGFRGAFRDNKIFTIRKYFNKIEFVATNTHFYFDPANALSKSAEANISPSVLFTKKISDTDNEKNEYLIQADDIFLTEFMNRVKPPAPRGVPADAYFSLGTLSKDKSKILKIKNYPKNSEVLVEYVYENPYPSVGGGPEVTDERNVSIQIQHTFIEMPQNGYRPRYDDPRVGYFITNVNDMTSPSATPYKDLIHRWKLEKKDKTAELSEPIEPITWWIEKTTPREFRETIKKAALAWNEAFETAGFKNALVIYEQSDTTKWDAGDIRYNVLRWTSSPNPAFGGYGPSFVNPRTGEILGSDIMLEYVFVTNRLKLEKLFDRAGLIQGSDEKNYHNNECEKYCLLSDYLHQSTLFGKMSLQMSGVDSIKVDEFMKQSLYYLVLHELGHTLGLNHNMKASQLYSPANINNKNLTQRTGLIGSVMDYPTANISVDQSVQGEYFTSKPGPYDKWAIEFGYRQFNDSIAELQGTYKILNRSTEQGLAFGNDADDMRSAGLHLDPRVMINDLSSDAITYMSDRFRLADKVLRNLQKKYTVKGQSYHELRNAYLMITAEQGNAAMIISRYVGGIYVDRSVAGQTTRLRPFIPVPLTEQKRAFNSISKLVFAPAAFKADNQLYNYLQVQRRGFGMYGQNEDPKIHDRILGIHKNVLDHWLHPNVLKRLTDSELYGNKYSASMFLDDLTNAIFKADLSISVNGFRQNLQSEYCSRLANAIKNDNSPYDHISKAGIIYQLKKIQKILTANPGVDIKTKSHRQYLAYLIDKGLSVNK